MLRFVLMIALMASSFALPQFNVGSRDRVRDLVDASIDYFLAYSKTIDPLKFHDIKFNSSEEFLNGLIKANGRFFNGVVLGAANARVNVVKTDPKSLTAQLDSVHPELKIQGDYEIDGEVVSKKVKGKGRVQLRVFNQTLGLTNVQLLEAKSQALRVESLGIKVDLTGLVVTIDGLTVVGMTVADFEKFVAKSLLDFWNSRFKYGMNKMLEFAYVNKLNFAIGKRTMEQCIQWLKTHKGE